MTTFLAALLGTSVAFVVAFALIAWSLRDQKRRADAAAELPFAGRLSLKCSKCGHTAAYVRSEPRSDPDPRAN
jgi:hypothetical protein